MSSGTSMPIAFLEKEIKRYRKCPKCLAGKGQFCLTLKGAKYYNIHAGRKLRRKVLAKLTKAK